MLVFVGYSPNVISVLLAPVFISNLLIVLDYGQSILIKSILSILFAYLISVSSIYLVYCLVWKPAEGFSNNIIRLRMLILHLAALSIAVLDFLFSKGWFSFFYKPAFCSVIWHSNQLS
jgi:hypothetical protein